MQQMTRFHLVVLWCLIILTFLAPALSAQAPDPGSRGAGELSSGQEVAEELQRRVVLAMTREDYPVTPGDVYELSFIAQDRAVSIQAMMEHTMRLNLGILGVVDVRGMTFPELRNRVEELVRKAYPKGYPRLLIRRVGEFQVYLKGEVIGSGYVSVDGLSRLDNVVSGRASAYASERDVEIRRADGSVRRYDLFAARRDGDESQNPYVRPGDTVVLSRAERQVELGGAVRREGKYQLLPGEELRTLIERYGDGATAEAYLERIQVLRIPPDPRETSITFQVNLLGGKEASFALADLDRVTVQRKDMFLPVVYFEGALVEDLPAGAEAYTPGAAPRYARVPYRFSPGAMLSEAVRSLSDKFLPEAALAEAYLIRTGMDGIRSVNLEELLYRRDPAADLELQTGDRIVVPFRQFFVTVSGAVRHPGRFPYVQGKSYRYYANLAGGVDPNQRWGTKPRIRDAEGRRIGVDDEIPPEANIHFRTNSFFFYAVPVATILSATVSIILTIDRLTE